MHMFRNHFCLQQRVIVPLFCFFGFLPLQAQFTTSRPSGPTNLFSDYELIWSDEFDGKELDSAKWRHRQLGPRKNGVTVRSAVSLDGHGHLIVTVRKVGHQYHGGMIATDGLFQTKYGFFEARVKFQREQGWWPAFWLTSREVGAPQNGQGVVDDTAKNGTEIDIFEYFTIKPDKVQHTLHWNGYGNLHKETKHVASVPGLSQGFHTFGVDWQPSGYTFYVDGKKTWSTTQAISHAEQYIVLSAEISSWPGDITKAQLPDSVCFDYVRVWQKNGASFSGNTEHK